MTRNHKDEEMWMLLIFRHASKAWHKHPNSESFKEELRANVNGYEMCASYCMHLLLSCNPKESENENQITIQMIFTALFTFQMSNVTT